MGKLVVECRPGPGGKDAANFAGYLAESFTAWARLHRVTATRADGRRVITINLTAPGMLAGDLLPFAGLHRLQSVPPAAKGTRQTSSVHVAVLQPATGAPSAVPESELRWDVFRAKGNGGQGVNTTDSAVRLTHLPTGTVVTCQDARSQHQNRAAALTELAARLAGLAEAEAAARLQETRRGQADPVVVFSHNRMRSEVVHVPTRTRWQERSWARGLFTVADLRQRLSR